MRRRCLVISLVVLVLMLIAPAAFAGGKGRSEGGKGNGRSSLPEQAVAKGHQLLPVNGSDAEGADVADQADAEGADVADQAEVVEAVPLIDVVDEEASVPEPSSGPVQPAGVVGRPSASQQSVSSSHPPGNNGFVKINEIPFQRFPPRNVPHPGCSFVIAFYNYDEGDLWASWHLRLHPPTGGGELLSGRVFIGEDPAGGAGDLDAVVTVDPTEALAASGVGPHPQQGHHVKLTVHAEGSIGADTKHKVFWVSCPVAAPEAVPPPVVVPPPPPPPAVVPPPVTPPPVQPPLVLPGPREVAPPVRPARERLPVTGADMLSLMLAGSSLLFGGVGLRGRARRGR